MTVCSRGVFSTENIEYFNVDEVNARFTDEIFLSLRKWVEKTLRLDIRHDFTEYRKTDAPGRSNISERKSTRIHLIDNFISLFDFPGSERTSFEKLPLSDVLNFFGRIRR